MPERAGESIGSVQTPDARLAEALKPTVTDALRRSIRDEPGAWAETFFPILLPAIRMAVTSALRDMLITLNQILEHSLSLRSWRWRLEAWRTGRPFAEIVLLRTLDYRVEQLLLLDRHTGLPLASVAAPNVTPKDTDLVSAMLTALQDFISDSFDVDRSEGLRELHVGDFNLIVEQGSRAALAAAVRGSAPAELRETLRAAVDLIHQEFGGLLRDFRGDSDPFEATRAILEGCLQAQYRRPEAGSNTPLWVLTAAIALVLALWIAFSEMQARRWNRAVAVLRNTRGIAVTLADHRLAHDYVEGLRDPLAPSPETVLAANGIDLRRLSAHFLPFLSLDPDLVVKRARLVLEAPPTVSILLAGDTLKLRGTAPHAWILRTRTTGQKLAWAGIAEIQTSQLVDQDLEALRAEIEAAAILFNTDSSVITPEQNTAARALAEKTRRWLTGAAEAGPHAAAGHSRIHGPGRGGAEKSRLEPPTRRSRGRDSGRRGNPKRVSHPPRGRCVSQPDDRCRAPANRHNTSTDIAWEPPVIQKKICLLGTFAVGKSSLAARFVDSIFADRYRTTVGVRIHRKTVPLDDDSLRLIIWDLAGEDEFVVLRAEYLRGASGYILVADGTRRDTLDRAVDLHRRARKMLGEVPFVLIVNKVDRSEDWVIDEARLEDYAAQGWTIVHTSAKSGRGVEDAFTRIAKKVCL